MMFWLTLNAAFVGLALAHERLHSSAFGVAGINASYDYVVIGGGTAGLTLAARLAETASVAVVEAGGYYQVENGNNSVVPLNSLLGLPFIDPTENFPRIPLIDWQLLSTPQAGNRRIHYAQGKTLGGSSAINSMAYIRGTAGSYQWWADIADDQSYTFPNLLKYFKKSVHLTPPDLARRNAANATPEYDPTAFDPAGGPLRVSWNKWVDPSISWLAKALQTIVPINPIGVNSGVLNGAAWVTSTISPEHAYRESSQTSFLEYAIKKTGLIVYTHSQAAKILFDDSKKATNVSIFTQGVPWTLTAKKEIILSAGIFHSPQLLMVSGIGPRDTLESLNIPVIAENPNVGQNLWDPVSINVQAYITPPSGQSIVTNPATEPAALRQYLEDGSGPYSSAAGYLSFEKMPPHLSQGLSPEAIKALESFPDDWPDLEYVAGAFPSTNGTTMGALGSTIMKPLSRGNVTINSDSIFDQPVINLGWFTNPVDGEFAVAAVKRLREAWNSDVALSIRLGEEIIPGPLVQTDEQILEWVRNNAIQIWHACGTSSMGANSTIGVVDSTAKVFGVSGLRVVDVSAFPLMPPGHPQASVYMLAEKIADDIKTGR